MLDFVTIGWAKTFEPLRKVLDFKNLCPLIGFWMHFLFSLVQKRTISPALFHLLLTGHTGKSLRTKDVSGSMPKKEARSWEQSIMYLKPVCVSMCCFVILYKWNYSIFLSISPKIWLKISVTNFKETIWSDNNWAGGNVLFQVPLSS